MDDLNRTGAAGDHQALRPLRVLVRHSSSQEDINWAQEIAKHLRGAERFGAVEVWSDERLLRGGDEIRLTIDNAIERADVVLLLLSADFLASDTLQVVEIPKLMTRQQGGVLHVIPVVLRSCLWKVQPWLRDLTPSPSNGVPLASLEGDRREAALASLAEELLALRVPKATCSHGVPPPPERTTTPKASLSLEAGPTYNIHIHDSTVGPIGVGSGAVVTGNVVTSPSHASALKYRGFRTLPGLVVGALLLGAVVIGASFVTSRGSDSADGAGRVPTDGTPGTTSSYAVPQPLPPLPGGTTATAPELKYVPTSTPVAPAPSSSCLTPDKFVKCQRNCAAILASESAKCHETDTCLTLAKNRNQDLCLPRCEASRCR